MVDYPVISVIVPIYKVEKYLKKCLDSIINQTYNNLEIILVDDGSPDNCPALCDEYAQKDSRIRVIHKQNGGLSSARNAGFEIATSEYISFVDSDDYLNQNMYEKMMKLMLDTDADLCVCNYEKVDENGNILSSDSESPLKEEIINATQALHKLTEANNCYYVTAWNKIYKRNILTNSTFPIGKIHEDEFAIHYILDKCKRIATTSKAYYYYVQRNGSIMSQRSETEILDVIEALLDRYDYYCSIGHEDSEYWIERIYNVLYSFLRYVFACKSLSKKRRNEYFAREFQLLFSKSKKKAFKLLITYLYNTLPGRKFIKKLLQKARTGKNRICYIFKSIHLFAKMSGISHKIILFQTPLHGNIGDQAITIAEYRLLSEKLPNEKIVEVPGGEISSRLWNRFTMKMCVKKSDLVLVNGGGFLGTLWMNEERQIQKIMSNLYDRKIIILPQTSYYDNDETGIKVLETDQAIYKKCQDLTIFLRERISDDYISTTFQGVKHMLIPDMVLWLDRYDITVIKRENVLICLRNDKEKTQDVKLYIKQELAYLGEPFQLTDTVVNHSISPDKREKEVKKKIEEFSKARLIITDRLHGMVLAAIAQTPCVVILSKSHKVKGVYEWIKKLDYIELAEDISQIREATQKVLNVDKPHYDNSDVKNAFAPLIKAIQEWSKTK